MFRWKVFILWSLASVPAFFVLYAILRLIGFEEARSFRYALYGAAGGVGGAYSMAKVNVEEESKDQPGPEVVKAPWWKVTACSGLAAAAAAVSLGCIGYFQVRGRGGWQSEAMHVGIGVGTAGFVFAYAIASIYFAKRLKPSLSDSEDAGDNAENARLGNGLPIFAGASAVAVCVGGVLGFLTAIVSMRFGVSSQDAIDRGVVVGAIGLMASFCVSAFLFMMYLSADRVVSDATERTSPQDE